MQTLAQAYSEAETHPARLACVGCGADVPGPALLCSSCAMDNQAHVQEAIRRERREVERCPTCGYLLSRCICPTPGEPCPSCGERLGENRRFTTYTPQSQPSGFEYNCDNCGRIFHTTFAGGAL